MSIYEEVTENFTEAAANMRTFSGSAQLDRELWHGKALAYAEVMFKFHRRKRPKPKTIGGKKVYLAKDVEKFLPPVNKPVEHRD